MDLTVERLKELLEYDPENGLLTWKIQSSRHVRTGDVARCLDSKGYVVIRIDRKNYKAHRLAWLYMMGRWPKHFLDHANMVPSDNRWENLREANWQQSNANRGSKNSVGLKGVRRQYNGRWIAYYKRDFLGAFDSPEEAHAIYVATAKERHGEFFNDKCTLRKE